MAYILDSSALIAFIKAEPGHQLVAAYVAQQQAKICTVNLTEILSVLIRNGMPEQNALGITRGLSLGVIDFDCELAERAGEMIAITQRHGLSLGDRACLAAALRAGDIAVTADHAWAPVANALGARLEFIRPRL